LVAEGHRLKYGYLYNPAFATGISRIEPLPHQRIAVYEYKESVNQDSHNIQRSLFPIELEPPQTLITPKGKRNTKTVVNKV